MIAKHCKNKGKGTVSDSVNYAQREEKYIKIEKDLPQEKKAKCILLNNLSSPEAKVVKAEFKEINGGNKHIETNKKHGHEVVSFSEKDLKTLDTPQKRGEAVERYLEYRGIKKDNFQYAGWEHKDTKNIHIHVVYNRVGLDGDVVKARNKFETMAVACERTEKDLKLENNIQRKVIYAPETERGYVKNPVIEKEKDIIREPKSKAKTLDEKKSFVQDKINEALQHKRVSTPEELKAELQKHNIKFEFTTNVKGLAGTSFSYNKVSVKGSQIDFKASVLAKQLNANSEYKKTSETNIKIADTIYKEKGEFYKYESNINDVIQQNRAIDTKTEIAKLQNVELKSETHKQINSIQIKSLQDLELKQKNYVVELNKYEELKKQEPQKVPLFSLNKSEIQRQNEELKKRQNNAVAPKLPKFEILSNYEATREKVLLNMQKTPIIKNTYQMEKKQDLSKTQEQGLNATQQRILEKSKERKQEQNQEQSQSKKRGLSR